MFKNYRLAALNIIATAMLGVGSISAVFAQPSSASTDAVVTTKAEKRAEHKAARKENRAEKNAELSKLEKNGYSPSATDPTYPTDLQAAEKRAAAQ